MHNNISNQFGHRNSESLSDIKDEIKILETENQEKENPKVIQERDANVTLRMLDKYERDAGSLTDEVEKSLRENFG